MRRLNIQNNKTSIAVNESYIGERIEQKIERIITQNEPITDGAPTIYTERNDGVLPEYDIRTDRFDVAIDAMDKVSASIIAKRDNKGEDVKGGEVKLDVEAKPIQAT